MGSGRLDLVWGGVGCGWVGGVVVSKDRVG